MMGRNWVVVKQLKLKSLSWQRTDVLIQTDPVTQRLHFLFCFFNLTFETQTTQHEERNTEH